MAARTKPAGYKQSAWYQLQLSRAKVTRAANAREREASRTTDAQAAQRLRVQAESLRSQAQQMTASAVNERVRSMGKQELDGRSAAQAKRSIVQEFAAFASSRSPKFAGASDEEKTTTASTLLRANMIDSSSTFYAATRPIWDKPGIGREQRNDAIMAELGVSNLWDAIVKVEEYTGMSLIEMKPQNDYEAYKMKARIGFAYFANQKK